MSSSWEPGVPDPRRNAVDWSYGLVNLLIFAAGLGLVALGSWLNARRRRLAPSAVNLAK
jgi:hypothetical protein